jgi:hypothetical protein
VHLRDSLGWPAPLVLAEPKNEPRRLQEHKGLKVVSAVRFVLLFVFFVSWWLKQVLQRFEVEGFVPSLSTLFRPSIPRRRSARRKESRHISHAVQNTEEDNLVAPNLVGREIVP